MPLPSLTLVVETSTPEPILASLRRAAEHWRVELREVVASQLDTREPPLPPGSMLYRAATTRAAVLAERQLWRPGVATFHATPAGPFALTVDQWQLFARVGLPAPRSYPLDRTDPDVLEDLVVRLGGYPLIARLDDGEGGDGLLLARDWATLQNLAEFFVHRHMAARLVAFVPEAMHWRVVVVGDRVVTAYRNPLRPADFRSAPSSDAADYGLTPPPDVAAVALAAAQQISTEFAGVDVLEHPSGRVYLVEANTPCYFAQAERHGKADVGLAMVSHLLARAGHA